MPEASETAPGPSAEPAPDPAARGPRRPGGFWIGLVAALLVAIGAVYVWKLVAVSDVRREMTAARDSLYQRSLVALEQRTRDLLRLSVVPLGWAIRSEMLRRDLGRVDAFLTEFVQEEGVRRAVLGGPAGSILVSTDKNLEGQAFSTHFPAALLRLSEPEVREPEPGAGSYRIAVPILGPTRSLGVLVVDYVPEEAPLGPGPDPAGADGPPGEAAGGG